MPRQLPGATPGAPLKSYWEAETCGTHFIEEERFSREYFDAIERHRYTVEPFIPEFAEFERWKGCTGLEVGVGAGTDFIQFVRAGARMTGVDLTEAAIEHVRHRCAIYGFKDADLRVANAEKLPFDDDTFDFVYSWGVIHHAENTFQVFDEIYRVTKPGGTVKIMVYNLNATIVWLKWLHHALLKGNLRMGPRSGRRWALAHFQESAGTKGYTARDVRQMLAAYPHENLRFRFFDDIVMPGDQYARLFRVLRAIEPEAMRWFLTFEFEKLKLARP